MSEVTEFQPDFGPLVLCLKYGAKRFAAKLAEPQSMNSFGT